MPLLDLLNGLLRAGRNGLQPTGGTTVKNLGLFQPVKGLSELRTHTKNSSKNITFQPNKQFIQQNVTYHMNVNQIE